MTARAASSRATTGTLPRRARLRRTRQTRACISAARRSVTECFSNFSCDPSSGYLSSQSNALAQVTSYQHDAVGRVKHLLGADGSDTAFGYDAESRFTSVTPSQRSAHSLTYTPVDLPKDYVAPPVGASPTITTLDYDLDRALESIKQPDGQQQTFSYDPSKGRLQSVTIPGAGKIGSRHSDASRARCPL